MPPRSGQALAGRARGGWPATPNGGSWWSPRPASSLPPSPPPSPPSRRPAQNLRRRDRGGRVL